MIQVSKYLNSTCIAKAKGVHNHKDVVLPSLSKSNVVNLLDWKLKKEEEDYVLHQTSIKFY